MEFDLQAIVRAHLGHGPIPVSDEEMERATPFIVAWTRDLQRSAAMYRQSYDLGARARTVPRMPSELRPTMPTPLLRGLLELVAEEGHDVDGAIDELDALHDAVRLLASHLHSVKTQFESSAAAMASLFRRRSTDRPISRLAPLKLAF